MPLLLERDLLLVKGHTLRSRRLACDILLQLG